MLQAMRDRVMGMLGWIVIGLIIITFALFGLSSYMQNRARAYAAKVNDVEISTRELQLAYQNQRANLVRMMGKSFDPAKISEQRIRKQALEGLIRRQLLLQAAKADGMAVSDQLLAVRIHAIPVFQDDGKFSKDRYENVLRREGQLPVQFEHRMREILTGEQLVDGVSDTVFVTAAELDHAYSLQKQKRSFDYVTIAAKPLKATIQPDDAQIQAYYEQHKAEFVTPQRVRLSYVRLNADVLGKGIDVSDKAVENLYEQQKASLKTTEQRRASHILFQLAPNASEQTVNKTRAKAEKVLKQIRDGADFAKLAKEYSADPGSASKGGDLGYFPAGTMVPEFDKAVSGMKVGDVSDLVRTQFGFHIIKLTDIRAGKIPPLKDVRDKLVKQIKQHDIDDRYADALEKLTDSAYEHPDSLQASADALGLQIKTSDWISADAGDGIGKYPAVRAAAFNEDVLEAGNNSEPVEVGMDDSIVVRVKDREPAHPTPLSEVKDKIVAAIKQEEAAKAARKQGEALLKQLAEGKSFKKLADAGKLVLKQADGVGRRAPGHDRQLIEEVFKLQRPAKDRPLDKGLALANGDYVVLQLTAVQDADPTTMTKEERGELKRAFENMRGNAMIITMVDSLRSHAKVDIPKETE